MARTILYNTGVVVIGKSSDRRVKTMRRVLRNAVILCLVLVIALGTLPASAAGPQAVLKPASLKVNLADGYTLKLNASVTPAAASQEVKWKTSSEKYATVDQNGLVTFKRIGTVTVSAKAVEGGTWANCKITIRDTLRPTKMVLSAASKTLLLGTQYTLTAELLPAGTVGSVTYACSKAAVASVDPDGTIHAKAEGECEIRVRSTRNPSLHKTMKLKVTRYLSPSKLLITPEDKKMNVGDTLQLQAVPVPDTASDEVIWQSSNRQIATVTEDGLVTAHAAGSVRIRATSKAKKKVATVRTIKVSDPYAITSVTIPGGDQYLCTGEMKALSVKVKPATAYQNVTWESSDPSAVSVSDTGVITANRDGVSLITATGANGVTKGSITVTAYTATGVTIAPEHTTPNTESAISANLKKIDDVRLSAYQELDRLVAAGRLTAQEAAARRNILISAFADAAFPWYTEQKVKYWNKHGAFFKTDRVYYGVPYTQGKGGDNPGSKRRFNIAKLLSGGHFVKSGDIYRAVNKTGKMTDVTYCGSDCSAFVSMCIWGTKSSYSYMKSGAILHSTIYSTIDKADLKPGDLLVKNGHVVLFLYYTGEAKHQMMIVEQGGGSEPNIVAIRLRNTSYYNVYKARRRRSFQQ